MPYSHVQRVRVLYKTILRLHRGLPTELRVLGSSYVQEEFKRHKNCGTNEAELFIQEWTNYAITLTKQLGVKGPCTGSTVGMSFNKSDLDKFKDEQLYQLHDLMEAAKSKNEPNR